MQEKQVLKHFHEKRIKKKQQPSTYQSEKRRKILTDAEIINHLKDIQGPKLKM